jgi:hypothetical protein
VRPSPSKVSRYMGLRPLPPSMMALVSRVVPTSGSIIRGDLPNFRMLSWSSVQSKVIVDLDQQRYFGQPILRR